MTKRKPPDIVRAGGILLMTRGSSPKFLLMRHTDRWDLPKGHCQDDESFRDAALRETWEETGIKPSRIDLDPDFQFELTYPVRYKRWDNQLFPKTVHISLAAWIRSPSWS